MVDKKTGAIDRIAIDHIVKLRDWLVVERLRLFRLKRAIDAYAQTVDWRAGLGRSLCSVLARSFVCECHTISAVPRFQPPPRRTQHADFPHCALLFASPQGLWSIASYSARADLTDRWPALAA